MAENAADCHHFNFVHNRPEFSCYIIEKPSIIMKFIEKHYIYKWSSSWNPYPPPEQHMAKHLGKAAVILFGYTIAAMDSDYTQLCVGQAFFKLSIRLFNIFELHSASILQQSHCLR